MSLKSQYLPGEVEDRIFKFWMEKEYFRARVVQEKEPFSIVIPPPNVTGILHMGHALNNIIQDVLIRFNRMKGREVLWMPGTDHAGSATQNVVERHLMKEGLKKDDLGRDKFIERLWEWKKNYGSTIIEQLKKLGASCDWERTRFTMDDAYSATVKEAFVLLYKKGLIYRGNYIINWCPRCRTALSDEEASHNEVDGWLYYLKYPVFTKDGENKYIVVATTRPETMLGDTAVAVNPQDARYEWLKQAKVILPLIERELTVIEDEAVDPEFGTGVVKVTPAHDPVDFIMGKKHGLEFINIMNDDASLNEEAGEFAGMDRFEARAAVLEVLRKKKLIEKEEPYKISAGHCYRCHTIVEPRISLQWFVSMKPLAGPALDVVEKDVITFHPPRWKKVYLNWMYNIQDWCISRQIWWGHRIPVYYCKKCQERRVAKPGEEEHSKKGIIVSVTKPEQCPECGSSCLVQDEDVLDTWFSSWLWPFATFYWPEDTKDLNYFYPTKVLVTASEILFFWVARMIMAGMEFKGRIPFEKVIIHGTVRDDKGVKMSKSLGNVIDPLEIINKYGTDSLRFSLMLLAASGSDVYLSDEKFLVGRNFCNKLWNATRFLLMKISESGIILDSLEFSYTDIPDKWVLGELSHAVEAVTCSLESFRINDAAKYAYEFFWHIFCDWYIEIAKDDFDENRSKVAIYCLVNLLKLLHPVIPFITEEIFQIIKSSTLLELEEAIMVSPWPEPSFLTFESGAHTVMNDLINMIREIRNLKVDLGISPAQKIEIFLSTNKRNKEFFSSNKKWIARLACIREITFTDTIKRVLFKTGNIEGDFSLEEFDAEKFMQRLDRKIEDINSRLSKVSAKLRNEGFLKNAPKEMVEAVRDKNESLSVQAKRFESLTRLLTEI